MRTSRLLLLAAALFIAASAFASADPTYTALRGARPDGRTIALNNFVFERDAYRFTLNGALHLLSRVDGKDVGAVFTGNGSYTLTPVTEVEKRQLQIWSNDDKLAALTDTFESAVFYATDLIATAGQQGGGIKEGTPNSAAAGAFDDFLKKQRKEFYTNFQLRVLQDVIDGAKEPVFIGYVNGKKYPPAILAVDPRGIYDHEKTVFWVADQTKGGMWYLSHLKREHAQGKFDVHPPLLDAENYEISTNIAANAEMSGTTIMTVRPSAAVRVLPFNLAGPMRISSVAISPAGETPSWTEVPFIQEDKDEDSDAALVVPTPLEKGKIHLIKVSYKGREVLRDSGDGNYTVGARTSWYPNVDNFKDVVPFQLTFRFPQKYQIVAVGEEVENRVEGEERVSVWRTPRPVRVAGFNYGKFKKVVSDDKESGMKVEVYTNPGEPDIIREINAILSQISAGGYPGSDEDAYVGPSSIRVNTGSLAQAAIADGVNTARTGKHFFGVLPANKVAVTQQSAWFSGQSWPSLVYLPYLAFVDGTTRNTLGLNSAKDFIDLVGPHEMAHQWWGHHVGWKTYHDQWLSEGFAEFTSGLVLQQTKGNGAYNSFWEKKRKLLMEKDRGATLHHYESGPITLGWRASTWRNPGAYSALSYEKGAYVVHMLRMAMADPRSKNPDEAFIAMMTDFANTYAGKNPSTYDFQTMVEKHATPSLKITTDGKLDWFFRQWVEGTAIPKHVAKLDFESVGGGKYRLKGTVTQSEVPDDFMVVMPLYVNFDKNSFAKLGSVALLGNTTKEINVEVALPKKPKSFTINAMHDVLSR